MHSHPTPPVLWDATGIDWTQIPPLLGLEMGGIGGLCILMVIAPSWVGKRGGQLGNGRA